MSTKHSYERPLIVFEFVEVKALAGTPFVVVLAVASVVDGLPANTFCDIVLALAAVLAAAAAAPARLTVWTSSLLQRLIGSKKKNIPRHWCNCRMH